MSDTTLLLRPDEDEQRATTGPRIPADPTVTVLRPDTPAFTNGEMNTGRGQGLYARDGYDARNLSSVQMIVDCPLPARHEVERHTRQVLTGFAGTLTDTVIAENRQRITATFPHVCDSTHAASSLIPRLRAMTSTARRDADHATRIVICMGPPAGSARHPSTAPERVRTSAARLLRQAGDHEAVLTGATAALAGPTLPAGVELVHLGRTDAGVDGSDRLYGLRVAGAEGIDGSPSAASNVDWARRLGRHQVPLADADRAMLDGRWRGALGGAGTIALVTSPDGHAASAGAAELALGAHASGAVVLHGRWDPGAPRPYGAFREALGIYAAECSLARVRADLDRWGWEVARLLPELGARLGSPPAPPGPRYDEGCRVGDALSGWFRAIAARNDLLVVLDGAQWADRASLHLCEQLSNDLADHRVLVAICGAEREMRANGRLDITTALTTSVDGDEHWITLDPS